jgi:hypothetical protein
VLLGSLQHGACTIQPTKIAFTSDELVDMIHRCGLNRLNQFATFLGAHLRNSRNDSKLLALLGNLDEVIYSGLPLAREEEDWAYRNGIKLRVGSETRGLKPPIDPFSIEPVWEHRMRRHDALYGRL